MNPEEILDKHGAGICRWGDFDTQEDAYVFQNGSLTREAAIAAMQEYSSLQCQQEREKAIEDVLMCIDELCPSAIYEMFKKEMYHHIEALKK